MNPWEAIKAFGIHARREAPDAAFFSIPDGFPLLAIEQIYRALHWINDEFEADCAAHPNVLTGNDPDQRDFVVRNLSRTLSYVVQALLLVGIFEVAYRKMVASLQIIDPTIIIDTAALAQRKAEIREIKKFRDKVAAHTVFARPQNGDNEAQELQSLISLISSSYDAGAGSRSFRLGGVGIRLGPQAPRHRPEVAIMEMHPLVMAHCEQWVSMMREVCTTARASLPRTIGDISYYPAPAQT